MLFFRVPGWVGFARGQIIIIEEEEAEEEEENATKAPDLKCPAFARSQHLVCGTS